jgi:hypothetical protein
VVEATALAGKLHYARLPGKPYNGRVAFRGRRDGMPKQNGRKSQPGSRTARRETGKQVVIEDRIQIALGMLREDEREAVREAINSRDHIRLLVKGAKLAGSEGKLRVADITPGLRLVFRETPRQIQLIELFSKEAFDSLGIIVSTPKRAKPAKRRHHVGEATAAP